jgi:hypothetical protein
MHYARKKGIEKPVESDKVLWWTNLAFSLLCIYNVVPCFVQKNDFAQGNERKDDALKSWPLPI